MIEKRKRGRPKKVIEEPKVKKTRQRKFNLQKTLRASLPDITKALLDQIKAGKSPRAVELALKTLGELVEKKEETIKFELSTGDKQELTAGIIDALREEVSITGVCSVCGERKTLRHDPCILAKSKQSAN